MATQASVVSFLSGPVTRTWRVGPRLAAVTLEHNTVTGSRALAVNSAEVPGTAGSFTFFSAPLELSFSVDGYAGRVVLVSEGGNVVYRCLVAPPGGGAAEEVAEENALGAGLGAESHKLRLAVEAWEEGVGGERGEPVVYYRVRATREADERSTVVHRRFRDFAALNDAVRAAYKGSQLLGSCPQPPPRGLPFFDNQDDPGFREKRRWLCADFLCAGGEGRRARAARARGLERGAAVGRGARAPARVLTPSPPPRSQARGHPAHAPQCRLPVLRGPRRRVARVLRLFPRGAAGALARRGRGRVH